MAKLYPPNIEGTIPAFTSANGTTTLVVPFSLNKAVGASEVNGFYVKIKTISGTLIATLPSKSYDIDTKMEAYFNVSSYINEDSTNLYVKDKLSLGLFYKVQLAFVDNEGEIGYYSTVGVVKYTCSPTVTIYDMDLSLMNFLKYTYTGVYSQAEKDASERLYSSRFKLYNNNKELLLDSGDILHNTLLDDASTNELYEVYTIPYAFETDTLYYVSFSTVSINKLETSSPLYKVIETDTVNSELSLDKENTTVELNYDNAYIEIKLMGKKNDGEEIRRSGSFTLVRKDNKSSTWIELTKFRLKNQRPSSYSWKDFTIEQGYEYTYALVLYNETGLTSNKIYLNSSPIEVDFEDAFLYDGERQLKIRYNPKVSTFKNDILESKVDTIGSLYPYIFRNGYVKYKEFLISGLLSYFSDSEELFATREELATDVDFTYDIYSRENVATERLFKNKVLDWLTNGEPKVFKTPTEGNFIVRLMNVSLSPTDSLGRLLHTFSCTAYEIKEYSYENLKEYGFIITDEESNLFTQVFLINFDKGIRDEEVINRIAEQGGELLNRGYQALLIRFNNISPAMQVLVEALTDTGENISDIFLIGGPTVSTFSYSIDYPIISVKIRYVLVNGTWLPWADEDERILDVLSGTFMYTYTAKVAEVFSTYVGLSFNDVPIKLTFGRKGFVNLKDNLEDIKTQFVKYHYLIISAMERSSLYTIRFDTKNVSNCIYYTDAEMTKEIDIGNLDIYKIYLVYENGESTEYYIYKTSDDTIEYVKRASADWLLYSIDGAQLRLFDENDYPPSGEVPRDVLQVRYSDAESFKEIKIGPGVKAEFGYQTTIIEYAFELENVYCINTKSHYVTALNKRWDEKTLESSSASLILSYTKNCETTYKRYIQAIENALAEYIEVNLLDE